MMLTAVTTNLYAVQPERFAVQDRDVTAVQDPALCTMYFTNGLAEAILMREYLRGTGWKVVMSHDRIDGDYVILTDRPDERAPENVDHYLAVYNPNRMNLVVTHHTCWSDEGEEVVEVIAENVSGDLTELGQLLSTAGWTIEREDLESDADIHPDLLKNANLEWALREENDGISAEEWICTIVPKPDGNATEDAQAKF